MPPFHFYCLSATEGWDSRADPEVSEITLVLVSKGFQLNLLIKEMLKNFVDNKSSIEFLYQNETRHLFSASRNKFHNFAHYSKPPAHFETSRWVFNSLPFLNYLLFPIFVENYFTTKQRPTVEGSKNLYIKNYYSMYVSTTWSFSRNKKFKSWKFKSRSVVCVKHHLVLNDKLRSDFDWPSTCTTILHQALSLSLLKTLRGRRSECFWEKNFTLRPAFIVHCEDRNERSTLIFLTILLELTNTYEWTVF